ncbi:MAG TPA: carboxypeptidase-like regulatory domain-containing protein [Mucilaginibacter sp.]
MPTVPECIRIFCVRLSLICIFLIFCHALLFAQTTITGRVVNHNDKKPIANASIFLSNTTIGNESAKDGNFILKGIKSGKYQIIVSVVGFKTYNENIVANDNPIDLHDIELVPEVKTLKEVSIRYKADPDRELYLKLFKDQFIGTSELASDCVLINPEVLDLDYDKSKYTLTASSYDFLKIENKDLGYRLKYLVKDFSYCANPTLKRPLHYQGFVLFEEMKGTAGQERRWKRNRQNAYEGSEMHFFRSVVSNRLNEEGFRVLQWAIYQNPERPPDSIINSKIKSFTKLKNTDSKKYNDSLKFWEKKKDLKKVLETLMDYPLSEEEIVKLTDQKDMYALGCDMDNLHITYNKDLHFSKKGLIYHLDEASNRESSVISFSKPYAFFDNNGIVLNINSISLSGVWARNRVAELLPYDYEPEVSSVAVGQAGTLQTPSKAFNPAN